MTTVKHNNKLFTKTSKTEMQQMWIAGILLDVTLFKWYANMDGAKEPHIISFIERDI
jgi:hypothetical protein